MPSSSGSLSLRKGRYSQAGHAYHVTLVVQRRKTVFNDFQSARLVIKSLMLSDEMEVTETLSFCVMPDHIHWLFCLKSGSLSQTVARVKSNYSRISNTKIWQDGFHDHLIRTDENLTSVARYIVANPIRAKLVDSVADYPHWDATWL